MENKNNLYKAVNYLNSIKFKINTDLLNYLENEGSFLIEDYINNIINNIINIKFLNYFINYYIKLALNKNKNNGTYLFKL